MKERQQKYIDEGDTKKVARIDRKIKFQDNQLKVLKGERRGDVSIKEAGSKNIFKFYGDKPKILQSEGISDQAFYETNQTKTNVVFVSPNNSPQVASSGKGGGVVVLQEPISISMIDNKLRKTALYKG